MRAGSLFTLFCAAAVFFTAGCAGTQPVTQSVRFTLFGNTSPESPFSGFNKSFESILKEIEDSKPQIIIHTGNAIYGGNESDGILESDVRRQMNIFFPLLKKLHTAIYTFPGDKDYFNNSSTIYSEFSGRPSSYSFNYGTIHFICLSPSETSKKTVPVTEIEWLKKDLAKYQDSSVIFVFTHRRLFYEKKHGKSYDNNDELHTLFLNSGVKYVFSGEGKDYSIKEKDAVKYINAGCEVISDKKTNRKTSQFYIVDFLNNEITIAPVNISIHKNNKGKN